MSEQNYSWEQLNAYVDGELSPAIAADIAATAVNDPDIAQAIATLTRLKAASRRDLESKSEDAPLIQKRQPTNGIRTTDRKWPFALAASLVLFALVGGAVWYGLQPVESPPSWIAAAEEQHEEWLASATEIGREGQSVLHEAIGTGDDFMEISVNNVTGYAPDLSSAGMRITRFSSLQSENGEQFFIGYVGENGCQLSLTMGAAPEELGTALSVEWQKNNATASWRVGDTAYTAVAHKMHRERFDRLTAYIEEVTRKAAAQEKTTHMAGNIENGERRCLV